MRDASGVSLCPQVSLSATCFLRADCRRCAAVPQRSAAMAPPRNLEKELEALRRVAANKACPSCSAVAPFGFRDVCVKFATLVCSDCKAAHQARALRSHLPCAAHAQPSTASRLAIRNTAPGLALLTPAR